MKDILDNLIELSETNKVNDYIAPLPKRMLTFIIDYAIYVGGIIFLIQFEENYILGTHFEENFSALAGLYVLFFPFFYKTIFEFSFGKTIGKFFTSTKVVQMDGEKISFGQAIIRSLTRYSMILDMISILFIKDRNKTLHDVLSKTRVVTDNYYKGEFV